MWGSEDGTQPLWMTASTPLDIHKFRSLTGTSQMPGNVFRFFLKQQNIMAKLNYPFFFVYAIYFEICFLFQSYSAI